MRNRDITTKLRQYGLRLLVHRRNIQVLMLDDTCQLMYTLYQRSDSISQRTPSGVAGLIYFLWERSG